MAIVVVLTTLALATSIVLFANRRPGYSHIRQTISELGERGAADGRIVSLVVFLPVGLALAAVWYARKDSSPASAALAGVIAIGYCGAALFPCDPGSPAQGSTRQAIHNLAGGVEYLGGAVALWRLGTQGGPLYFVLASVVALAIAFLTVPSLGPWRGVAQRIGEAALFIGLALAV